MPPAQKQFYFGIFLLHYVTASNNPESLSKAASWQAPANVSTGALAAAERPTLRATELCSHVTNTREFLLLDFGCSMYNTPGVSLLNRSQLTLKVIPALFCAKAVIESPHHLSLPTKIHLAVFPMNDWLITSCLMVQRSIDFSNIFWPLTRLQQLAGEVQRQPPHMKLSENAEPSDVAFSPSIEIHSIAAFLDLGLDRINHNTGIFKSYFF